MNRYCAAGLASLIASVPVHAQDLTLKAPRQQSPVAIVNAIIHPVSREDIGHGYIIFDRGVITDVGAGEAPHLPAATRIIDAAGKHIYPGLISPYTQLGLTEIQSVAASIDASETGRVTPEVAAASAVNPDSTLIPVTRSNGILTVMVFPSGGLISGQPSVLRLDGWTTEEMTVRRSTGQVLNWPNMRTFSAWWMDQGEDEQQRNIKRDQDAISQIFQSAQAYSLSRDADPQAAVDLRWEAMRPLFSNAGKPPSGTLFIRANSAEQITAAVGFAERTGVSITIVGGREAPQVAPLLKKHSIPVIVLGTHNLPRRDDEPYDEPFTLPARLKDAGIIFAISHNDDTAHERNLPYQVATAVAYGLDQESALKCVTTWSAQICGVESTLGSLDVGKAATLLITSGNPLEITTRIQNAFIDGRDIDLSNKQTRLAEKYRERYRQMNPAASPAAGSNPASPPAGSGTGGTR